MNEEKIVDETWLKRFNNIKTYGIDKSKEVGIQLKDLWFFGVFVLKNRKDIYKSMKEAQKQEQHILSVAKYITEQNESNLRNRKKTLAEEDEETNLYKLVGTMDRSVVEKYAGDALILAEKKKGDRIKMGELRE